MAIDDSVTQVFNRLAAGELTDSNIPVQDGWEVKLPSGKTVARSTLQTEAEALIALGPHAVPALLRWVMHDNPALRYVAIYALGQITGENPYVPYFDQADVGEHRARAIDAWTRWYAAHDPSGGSPLR